MNDKTHDSILLIIVISIPILTIGLASALLPRIHEQTRNNYIMPLVNNYNECLTNDEGNCIGNFFSRCNNLNREMNGLIVFDCEYIFVNDCGSYSDLWGED